MNWWQKLLSPLLALFRKEALDADMEQELHSHLELQMQANLESGMQPKEAKRAAACQFGSVEAVKEICRDQRGLLWLEQLLQDLRYGARMLRKNPGFTVGVATLALGIGVNTAIFSIISAVVLQPLPYPDSERLVELNQSSRTDPALAEYAVSAPNYRDWRALSRSFSHVGIDFYSDFSLTEGEQLRPVRGWYLSSEVLPALGVRPMLGRALIEEDETAGGVALLGYNLWHRLFGSETNLTGKSIVVNDQRVQVAGVMPAGFNFPAATELWLPLPASKKEFQDRGWPLGHVVGRLRPGVSIAQAQSEMDLIARQLAAQYPKEDKGIGIRVASLHSKLIAGVRPVLPILFGAAAFILLIACANLANLLLSRNLARQKELAIRAAVGAGNGRLIRQLLAESLLLSFLGTAAGFIAVIWSRSLWAGLAGRQLPRFAVIKIDSTVWWFALGVAIFTGLLCGLVPAWRIWRADPHDTLKQGGQRSTTAGSSARLRSGLVVTQLALALVLLIGAGLALKSVYYLLHPGLQVDPRKVLVMDLHLPKARYPEDTQRLEFFEHLITRLQTWPTVEAAGAASFVAFGSGMSMPITLEERPEEPPRRTFSCDVSPDFFKTIGVPLLRGRELTAQDRKGAPLVAVINETMARRYWPGENPIGKRFGSSDHWTTVVGVVRDLRPGGVESSRRAEYYPSWYQQSFINTLVVRTAVDPAKLIPQIQDALQQMDKTFPPQDVETLDHLLGDVASENRTLGILLTFFAGLALTLAVVGIYGVIAYTVSQRTHEFGVRMALGARKADVVMLVLKWGGRLALIGTALGLVLAWSFTRVMGRLIEGVSPRDATIFVIVPWVLLGFALIGCYFPAYRASGVDPMSSLRNE